MTLARALIAAAVTALAATAAACAEVESIAPDASTNRDASPPQPPRDGGIADTGPADDAGVEMIDAGTYKPLIEGDCDPIVPEHCGLPFPSNVWTRPDLTSSTGVRVNFGATTLPKSTEAMGNIDPSAWNQLDGFSPGTPIITFLAGTTTTGLASINDIARSLEPDSPTLILDADTFERIPHFAELDQTTTDLSQQSIMLRPAVRLQNSHRYIVALRHLQDAAGNEIPPAMPFISEMLLSDPLRVDLYNDIFTRLESVGVAREELQIAWDFTVASDRSTTNDLIAMREHAFMSIAQGGPQYRIMQIEENPNPHIRRRIHGLMTVPLFLTGPGPGETITRDPAGNPTSFKTAQYPFVVHIPNSATSTPAFVLQNGHGLLTDQNQGGDEYLAELADTKNYVVFATDWIGLSIEDSDFIMNRVIGDLTYFPRVIDRLHQAVINALLAMRMMRGDFAADPAVLKAIDPREGFYRGDSQGGILGVTYMALSPDVEKGHIGMTGMAYSLMLARSSDFSNLFLVLRQLYPDARDQQLILGLLQMQWDRVEGSGWAQHVLNEPIFNTPPKRVLIHVAIGDHQVPSIAGHLLARSIGVKLVRPVARSLFGLDEVDSPWTGSGLVEWDSGLVETLINVPQMGPDSEDPHGVVRTLEASHAQTDLFFRTGVIDMTPCGGECRIAPN